MGRKSWTWVFIPADAQSINDCRIFEQEPSFQEKQKYVGAKSFPNASMANNISVPSGKGYSVSHEHSAYIAKYPVKKHFAKGVKEMWFDEDGLLKRLPVNRLGSTLFASNKAEVVHSAGVINNRRLLHPSDMMVVAIKRKYEDSFPSYTGEATQIVGNVVVAVDNLDRIGKVMPTAQDYSWENIKEKSQPQFLRINSF
jgi:hypothetical protein